MKNKNSDSNAGVQRSVNACKITLAKSAGFCFGVKRALKIADDLARAGRDVRMLGDIVHNEDVIRDVEALGIRKIKRLGAGRGRTILIRAHGAARETLAAARRKGYKVVDATCPMVHEIHKIVKVMSRKGCRIIVIGDRRHDEVLGIIGQIKQKAFVVDSLDSVPEAALRRVRKAAVVVQSTQNIEDVLPIVKKLESIIPDLVFKNTICNTTRRKQSEIKGMPVQNDVMLVIGSKTSANTRRLYEISKSLNKQTHWINSGKDIRARWFKDAATVGIMAGASTPDYTTSDVIKRIRALERGL